MPLPGKVGEGIPQGACAAEVHVPVPVLVGRIPFPLLYILKGKKFPARVVEYPVHHHLDALLVAEGDKGLKCGVVSQAAVHLPVVPGVVAMAGGLEQRSYVDGITAKGADVGNPLVKLLKAVYGFCAVIVFWGSRHPQGIHVVKYPFFIPSAHAAVSSCNKGYHVGAGLSIKAYPKPFPSKLYQVSFLQRCRLIWRQLPAVDHHTDQGLSPAVGPDIEMADQARAVCFLISRNMIFLHPGFKGGSQFSHALGLEQAVRGVEPVR